MDGDVQILQLGAFVVVQIALGHEFVVPSQGGFQGQLFDGRDQVQCRRKQSPYR